MKNSSLSLLYYWCYKKTPNGSGLTIPFLIGANHFLTGNKPQVINLLSDLANNNHNFNIVLERCGNVNEYVLKLYNTNDSFGLNFYSNFNRLYFNDNSLTNCKNLEEVSDYFQILYSDCLNNDKFSKVYGNWVEFDPNDIYLIKSNCNLFL